VRDLIAAGIAVAATPDSIALRHGLLCDVIAFRLPPSELRELHRRIATALETDPAAPAARLARHWTRAREHRPAAPVGLVAADEAAQGRQYRTAADLYRGVLAHWRQAESAEDGDPLERAAVFERAAIAAGWAGVGADALEWANCADERFRAAGEQWRAAAM